jgi:uncharacterized protein
MKQHITALVSGFIFAIGLGISGMTNANKVLNFLDIFGNWDPSLAFVMVGAIGVHALLWQLIKRLDAPIFTDVFSLPALSSIGRPLVIGAALFGVGWGLSGYCPGPAVVSMVGLGEEAVIFGVTMLVGILVYKGTQPAS